MIEVERKYRLIPLEGEKLKAHLMGAYNAAASIRQSDEVFLKGINTFASFVPGMPVMRIRATGNGSTLTYKRSINASGDTVEHETQIESPESMRSILEDLGFIPVVTVDKLRLEAKTESVTIAYDIVANAGHFLEIEVIVEDVAAIPEAEKEIYKVLEELGLSHAPIELKKYDQLVAQASKPGVLTK